MTTLSTNAANAAGAAFPQAATVRAVSTWYYALAKRRTAERKALRHLILTAKAAGFELVRVFDGGASVKCTRVFEAMAAVFSVDESTIFFKHADQPKAHCAVIVLGNSGAECIADASMGEGWDAVMEASSAYCETLDA